MAKPSNYLAKQFLPTFSRYIRRKLAVSQCTLRQFSERVGVSYVFVSRLKSGKYLPSRETAARIGEAFEEPDLAMIAAGYIPRPSMKVTV